MSRPHLNNAEQVNFPFRSLALPARYCTALDSPPFNLGRYKCDGQQINDKLSL